MISLIGAVSSVKTQIQTIPGNIFQQAKYITSVNIFGQVVKILACLRKIFVFLEEQKIKCKIYEVSYIEPQTMNQLDFELCISQTKCKLPSKLENEENRSGRMF